MMGFFSRRFSTNCWEDERAISLNWVAAYRQWVDVFFKRFISCALHSNFCLFCASSDETKCNQSRVWLCALAQKPNKMLNAHKNFKHQTTFDWISEDCSWKRQHKCVQKVREIEGKERERQKSWDRVLRCDSVVCCWSAHATALSIYWCCK